MLDMETQSSDQLLRSLLPFLLNAFMGSSHQGPPDINREDNADDPFGFESFAKASVRFTSFMRTAIARA